MEVVSSIHIGGAGSPRVPNVDHTYNPATDFYMYVNAHWQKTVKMPSYEDDFGISEEIEHELRGVLNNALEKHMVANPSSGLSHLAKSFLDSSVQENSVHELIHLLNTLDCINSPESFAAAAGYLNNIQCRAPFSFVVNSDYYDSKKCCVYVYEGTLGMPSKSNYASNTSNKIINYYRQFLTRLGKLLLVTDLENALTFESGLIPYISNAGELSDVEYTYNPCTIAELEHKYPNIDWRTALLKWGLKSELVAHTKYVITNIKYITHINKLIKGGDYNTLILWMKSAIIINFLKYLPPPYDDIHYEFFGKALRGVDKKLPQRNLTLQVLMKFTPQDLSRIFVDCEVPEQVKHMATRYIKLLKSATLRRIQNLKWMEPSTRSAALKKAAEMRFQVAYPSKWESETAHLEIDSRRPLNNLLLLSSADTKKMINDLVHLTCMKRPSKWRDGAFEVNAYYYPEGNMMVVPAGILRPPFFDISRSDGWNLGSIGVAISHEITHGFDDDGRVFDADGNYKDWWTSGDERRYRAMSRAVIKLFDGLKYMGGKVNGKLTLNENLADLGGMSIALEALNSILPADESIRAAAYRDFFIGFAVSWRQKDRLKKARQALLLDVHAPPYYRVNMTVRQFEEFYIAFGIKSSDAGYIPVEDRIVFW